MSPRAWQLALGGSLLLGVGLAWAGALKLEDPDNLPQAARALLRSRMAHHAADMRALTDAVVLLDYSSAAEIARRVASEPQLARPTTQDATELNSRLPKRFFELQDRLMRAAKQVGAAAGAQDPAALATATSELTATCVTCHATYRSGH